MLCSPESSRAIFCCSFSFCWNYIEPRTCYSILNVTLLLSKYTQMVKTYYPYIYLSSYLSCYLSIWFHRLLPENSWDRLKHIRKASEEDKRVWKWMDWWMFLFLMHWLTNQFRETCPFLCQRFHKVRHHIVIAKLNSLIFLLPFWECFACLNHAITECVHLYRRQLFFWSGHGWFWHLVLGNVYVELLSDDIHCQLFWYDYTDINSSLPN